MADTIITPSAAPSENSGAGWVIAVILLIALIGAGAYAWTHYNTGGTTEATPAGGSANINVTLPPAGGDTTGGADAGGDSGGAPAGGGAAGGAGY